MEASKPKRVPWECFWDRWIVQVILPVAKTKEVLGRWFDGIVVQPFDELLILPGFDCIQDILGNLRNNTSGLVTNMV